MRYVSHLSVRCVSADMLLSVAKGVLPTITMIWSVSQSLHGSVSSVQYLHIQYLHTAPALRAAIGIRLYGYHRCFCCLPPLLQSVTRNSCPRSRSSCCFVRCTSSCSRSCAGRCSSTPAWLRCSLISSSSSSRVGWHGACHTLLECAAAQLLLETAVPTWQCGRQAQEQQQ